MTVWTCPHCGGPVNAAALLGASKSTAKAKASRENAKLGGWPKGKKRKKKLVRMPRLSGHGDKSMP